MSLNLNKVILAGRITADPELKQTPSGLSVTSFSVAVNRRFSKDSSEDRADFINVVAWRQTAEFVTRYFRKGSAICVCGSIQTRSWSDANGSRRHTTEVLADEVNFVESKSASAPSVIASTAVPQQQFEELSPDDELPF